VVLTTREIHQPPRYNPDIVVKTLASDSDWAQALQNQLVNNMSEEEDGPDFIRFTTREMERYRSMTQAGLGEWFGAFVGDRLVGGLGLFVKHHVGRFQEVGTHPDFRRQGICRSLVYQAARYAFERMGAETLVMVADEDYVAARIYEQVGFKPVERQVGIDRRP
jgi:ribosomal protein S18 acetylase RimI-like enzyme